MACIGIKMTFDPSNNRQRRIIMRANRLILHMSHLGRICIRHQVEMHLSEAVTQHHRLQLTLQLANDMQPLPLHDAGREVEPVRAVVIATTIKGIRIGRFTKNNISRF